MTTFAPDLVNVVTGLQGLSPFPLGSLPGSKVGASAPESNNESNLTVEELVLRTLGPQRKDLSSSVLLTCVYSLVFLSGFVGNVCTCVVIAKNHYMQTTTNYYLFSLAVSDLMLIIFGLPPELYTIWEAYPWRFGEIFCIFRHTVMEMTSYASVLTITAFTVERYVAICRPLLSHKMASLSRAVKIIIAVWVVAILAALPYAFHTRQFYELKDPSTALPVPESLVCNIPEKWRQDPMSYIFQVSTFVFFLTPVTIIICLYILIGLALRRSDLTRALSEESQYGSRHKDKNKNNSSHVPKQPRRVVMRILVAVAVAFIICWAPFHAQRLMVLYVPKWTGELMAVQSHLFYISGVLYFISSTVNPILYNVISKRYRLAFKETLCCCIKSTPLHPRDKFSPDRDRIASKKSVDGVQRNKTGSHVSFNDRIARKQKSVSSDAESLRVQLLDSPVARKPILRNTSVESQTCDSPLLNDTPRDSHVTRTASNGSASHHACLDPMEVQSFPGQTINSVSAV
ncbi:pyrokinin-1 receptor [Patella vulgata]|uniref:pyrokinin-1 receptor n=1 Tax=Patella vulgata TaxID=6465 RepID=UPI00217F6A5A|nr:pyrokinin-1 receptor [Patella vulgata]